MKIEVPDDKTERISHQIPNASPKATLEITPKSSPSTSPSTFASISPTIIPSLFPTQARPPNPFVTADSPESPPSPRKSVEEPSASDPEPGWVPFEVQFEHCLKIRYPDQDYYSTRYKNRLPSGYWLPNDISLDQVIENIPIVGYVNEYDQPIPSLQCPDIHLTLATIDSITRIGEDNDQTGMLDLGQVFHLHGPRKGQLHDAYAWIALRGNEGDKFVMSRRARNRLVPNWKTLIKDWEDFDETITDPCHEVRKIAGWASYQAVHSIRALCGERGINLDDIIEEIVDNKNKDHPAAELIPSFQKTLVAVFAFEDAIEEMQTAIDKMDS